MPQSESGSTLRFLRVGDRCVPEESDEPGDCFEMCTFRRFRKASTARVGLSVSTAGVETGVDTEVELGGEQQSIEVAAAAAAADVGGRTCKASSSAISRVTRVCMLRNAKLPRRRAEAARYEAIELERELETVAFGLATFKACA